MNLVRISDARLAAIGGVILTGVAAVLVATVQVFPGGFETQAVWGIALLPGAILALPLSDFLIGLARRAERIVFWTFLVSFSWPWYWLVSYCLLKIIRHAPRSWDGF